MNTQRLEMDIECEGKDLPSISGKVRAFMKILRTEYPTAEIWKNQRQTDVYLKHLEELNKNMGL